ncbi:MAG: S8 family serine peptidase, partial [Candidatus Marinimicrobia bacterium]|nr:S8 family serine peptidase [Candidatus Neomarinimicrobiota bacterium]
KPDYNPNDPLFTQQWHLPNIQATEAWDLWDISSGQIPGVDSTRVIKVGVVDTGVEWDHPDLVENIWQNLGEDTNNNGVTIIQSGSTWIFDPGDLNGIDDDGDGYIDDLIGWDTEGSVHTNGDNDPTPPTVGIAPDHGTNVSGCVSGVTNNGIGIAAVGWGIKIIPVKITNDSNGDLVGGYSGVLYAAKAGADVINCSWGGYGYNGGSQSIINVAHNTYGSIIVASAGNGYQNMGPTNTDPHYPSGYDNVISVTATDDVNDSFGCWATAGTTVDLAAPGSGIWTTDLNDGYESVPGTSFSSPIVAGAVGLLWSKFPDETQAWIEDRIVNSTDYFSDMDRNCPVRNDGDASSHTESMTGLLGSGRLNIFKALAGGLYPSLIVGEVNLQNDTDGDGIFNPGETVKLKPILINEDGWATATAVFAILSTSDPRITVLDNLIDLNGDIPAGQSSFSLFDSFQIEADPDAATGSVELSVTLYAGQEPYLYVNDELITVALGLNQRYFPYSTGAPVKTSPIAVDINGDGNKEIFFGTDDFKLHGVSSTGEILPGFPLTVGNQIRSSVAAADLDNDGDIELVFGSKDKNLYIIEGDGTIQQTYTSTGYIYGTPALADLDGDDDLEIIFGTTLLSGPIQSGSVYAIHHDGTDVSGYPIDVGEIIMAAPAVGDIDYDGIIDVVVGTWNNNIFAVSSADSIKAGFPYTTGNRINVAPVLANLTGDEKLELVIGSDDGSLYIYNHDGTIAKEITTTGYIRGGIALHDVDNDNYPEIFWGGYDSKLHAYNLSLDSELAGWPIDVGQIISVSPVIVDLDGDEIVEIVCAHIGGQVLAFSLDGNPVGNFPVTTSGAVEGSPGIFDIDGDGDLEILVGTSNGLDIFDYKYSMGVGDSWNVFRGSLRRTGYFQDAILAIESQTDIAEIPTKFSVSDNFPNPFNPDTRFEIQLPENSRVSVSIFDVTGRRVAELLNEDLAAGIHKLHWNGREMNYGFAPSGVYFLKVVAGGYSHTQKMVLVK